MKKKTKTHFHICGSHRWGCTTPDCNLSHYAHCGFKGTNKFSVSNFPMCVKGKKLTFAQPRFSFKADHNGFVVAYKGNPLVKAGLKAIERKQKRHPMTVKKQARQYQNEAQKLVSVLENGEGAPKIWAKVRKIDSASKADLTNAQTVVS